VLVEEVMDDDLNIGELDYLYNECTKYLDAEDAENASEYLDRFCALYLESTFKVAGEISKLEDKFEEVSEEEKPLWKGLVEKLREDYAFLNEHLRGIINIQQELGLTNAPKE
jgi:hypothetical protein